MTEATRYREIRARAYWVIRNGTGSELEKQLAEDVRYLLALIERDSDPKDEARHE